MRRFAVTAVVLGLLVATTTAFAVTENLKLERSPITRVRVARVFSPTCGCRQRSATLAVRLRRADSLDVVLVDSDGEPVRTLAEGLRRERGWASWRWGGRDDAGAVVPDGSYRLRVHLADDRRTIVVPNPVRVDTQAPAVELVSLRPRTLSPDGDERADAATIAFRVSEPARPLVLVDGSLAWAGKRSGPGGAELVWPGTAGNRPLRKGIYLVSLQARDRAGNVSAATDALAVDVRYIEIAGARLRARRGGVLRLRVVTDAARFDWILRRRGGRRPLARGTAMPGAVALQLAPRIRAGRYTLRVAANGHEDRTVVIVRAAR